MTSLGPPHGHAPGFGGGHGIALTAPASSIAPQNRPSAPSTTSTSLAQRFRRAISSNDLEQTKRIASKALALAETFSQGDGQAALGLTLDSRRPSVRTIRGSQPLSLAATHQPKLKLPLDVLVKAKCLPETTKTSELPVRQRALLRQKALAQGPFDIRNIDPDAPPWSDAHKSSLTLAIETKAGLEVIEWLLDMGHEAEGPTRDDDGNTLITTAALRKRPDVIALYASHPTVQAHDPLDWGNTKLGQTALHLAAVEGHVEVVKLLLDLGAEIDLPDREGNTALHFASAWGHMAVVQLLIEHGCSFAIKNASGFTPSDFAYSHSIKAALEAFARVQHEMRRRQRRAASHTNHSNSSTEDLNSWAPHFGRTAGSASGPAISPRTQARPALYEHDDDSDDIEGYHISSGHGSRSGSASEQQPSKAERILGLAAPATSQGGTHSPRLLPSRPSLSPFSSSTSGRHAAEPSLSGQQESRSDRAETPTGRRPSVSEAMLLNLGAAASKVRQQDAAAMSSFLSKMKCQ